MFTGIIETLGVVSEIVHHVSNIDFWIESTIAHELRVDQSVAHNGVCLTVVEIEDKKYRVTAVAETLVKTSLGRWKVGDIINIERALRVGDRLDGHLVQGHVDSIGECIAKEAKNGSWVFDFSFPEEFAGLVIEKGSICLNGVSLTVFDIGLNELSVAVIPYTFEHTNFHSLKQGDTVNIEFDVLGKYLLRHKEINQLNG
jgi:riboflavin synthase